MKVAKGQDPYNVIGNYIREHLTVIEDMIAVIRINDSITNELFLVDWDEEGYFVWHHDWWEGEENVELIDFFPVSDSERLPEPENMENDIISRQAAKDALDALCDRECEYSKQQRSFMCGACRLGSAFDVIDELPSAQPEKMQLSEEDATKSATFDCISRQAAIAVADSSDYVGLSVEDVKKVTDEVVKGLKRLPSAQPEHLVKESGNLVKGLVNDCIRRQAAIDVLRNRWLKTKNYEGIGEDIAEECEIYLRTVPSVQPEIIRCKDCKYSDENWRRVSVRWLPCMDMRTGSNWYCGSAERQEE